MRTRGREERDREAANVTGLRQFQQRPTDDCARLEVCKNNKRTISDTYSGAGMRATQSKLESYQLIFISFFHHLRQETPLCITCGCHHLATARLCAVFFGINHLLTWGVLRTNTGLRNRKRSPPAAWRWVRLLRRILSWEEHDACHVIIPLCCQHHSRFDVTHRVSTHSHFHNFVCSIIKRACARLHGCTFIVKGLSREIFCTK